MKKKKAAEAVPLLISTISELVNQTKSKSPSKDQVYISETESEEYFDADTYFEDLDEASSASLATHHNKPKSRIEEEIEENQTIKLLLKQLEENSRLLDTSLKQLETQLHSNPNNLSKTSYLILLSWPVIGISLYHLWNK
jgi:phenylpyruvate tautomerase PptA (4-oxalocrotonate tautomerase family)